MGFPATEPPTGAWRSLVARLNGVQEVVSSNLTAPIRDGLGGGKPHSPRHSF